VFCVDLIELVIFEAVLLLLHPLYRL